jgi:hypothetical protein
MLYISISNQYIKVMIVNKPIRKNQLEVDLTGPEGNSFYLIGLTKKLCKMLGMSPDSIIEDMTSSDYEHLIRVFDRNFGSIVTLYR